MLMGQVPSSAGYIQPLHLCHIGPIKQTMEALRNKDGIMFTTDSIASHYAKARTLFEANASKRGKSQLQAGFSKGPASPPRCWSTSRPRTRAWTSTPRAPP
jgi:hypothetical protein